jgi:hypothetical protein
VYRKYIQKEKKEIKFFGPSPPARPNDRVHARAFLSRLGRNASMPLRPMCLASPAPPCFRHLGHSTSTSPHRYRVQPMSCARSLPLTGGPCVSVIFFPSPSRTPALPLPCPYPRLSLSLARDLQAYLNAPRAPQLLHATNAAKAASSLAPKLPCATKTLAHRRCLQAVRPSTDDAFRVCGELLALPSGSCTASALPRSACVSPSPPNHCAPP